MISICECRVYRQHILEPAVNNETMLRILRHMYTLNFRWILVTVRGKGIIESKRLCIQL